MTKPAVENHNGILVVRGDGGESSLPTVNPKSP
jgi:hypothetical protein